MNSFKKIAGAAILSGLVSVSALASTPLIRTDLPTPATVVAPESVPARFVGTTVRVSFTIDEYGQPTDITLLTPAARDLARSIVPALEQWRFNPATRNGAPVSMRVILPLKLAPVS